MKRKFAIVILLGGMLVLLGMMEGAISLTRVGLLTGDATVIEVSCLDPRGCFLKVGEAIKAAPEGAIIKIGPGTY